jgi:hypothetical protein
MTSEANIFIERETPSPENTQFLPPNPDSIVGPYKSRGGYWLGASNHEFTTTCNCLDDPCSCNNKKIPDFTEEDVVVHLKNDAPVPGYIVDTKPFMRPVLYNPLEEN